MSTEPNSPGVASLLTHLDELRSRILRSAGYWLAGTLLCMFFARTLAGVLKYPVREVLANFIVTRPTDVISLYVKIAFTFGMILASPAILWEAWQFVKPAVGESHRLFWTGWIAAAVGLFAVGSAFAYFILIPSGLTFLIKLSADIATPMMNLNNYVTVVLTLLVLGGVVFELPVAVGLLTRLGLITPQLMRRRRKEAIFALLVAAAVLTPTTDVFNMLLFAAPLIALYEISILISSVIQRRALDRSHPHGGSPYES